MRLHLDDDNVDPGLIRLLRREGHDVEIPRRRVVNDWR